MFASIWSFGVESLICESKKLMEVGLFFDELAKEKKILFPYGCGCFDVQVNLDTKAFISWSQSKNVKAKGLKLTRLSYVSTLLLKTNINVCIMDPGAFMISKENLKWRNTSLILELSILNTGEIPASFHKKVMPLLERQNKSLYHPKSRNKQLLVTIDDVNMNSANNLIHLEHLRCYSDHGGWWFPDGSWYSVKNMVSFISLFSSSLNKAGNIETNNDRLLKKFALLMNEQMLLEDSTIKTFEAKLVRLCMNMHASDEVRNLCKALADLSGKIHFAMNDAFQTDLGKTYFSNEVFDRIWSSMECIDSNNFDSETSYLLVWYDSLKHVYGDHLSSHNDRKLLVKTLNKTIKSGLPKFNGLFKHPECFYDPRSYKMHKWEDGTSLATSWEGIGIRGGQNEQGIDDHFIKCIQKVSRVLRSEHLCPLVLLGDDRQAMAEYVISGCKLLGYAWALSYMKSLLSENETLDRKNNTVLVVNDCSWRQMSQKAWNGGVSVMNVILSKLKELKKKVKIVFIVETSDKHACDYWKGDGINYASVITTNQPPSSILMKSMSKLMDDTDDRSIAIPALISIFRQVSSVWQRNFGIPCVSKQLEECIRLTSRLIKKYINEVVSVAKFNDQNEKKIVALIETISNADAKAETLKVEITEMKRELKVIIKNVEKYEEEIKGTSLKVKRTRINFKDTPI